MAKEKVIKAKKVVAPKVVKPKPEAKKGPATNFSISEEKKLEDNSAALAISDKKTRKPRGPKKAYGNEFADLEKIKKDYESKLRDAKAKIKKDYDEYTSKAEALKVQYQKLFNENIINAPKALRATKASEAKKVQGFKPFTLQEVEDFLQQREQGSSIKLAGRRAKGILKLEEAYNKSADKFPEHILKLANS